MNAGGTTNIRCRGIRLSKSEPSGIWQGLWMSGDPGKDPCGAASPRAGCL